MKSKFSFGRAVYYCLILFAMAIISFVISCKKEENLTNEPNTLAQEALIAYFQTKNAILTGKGSVDKLKSTWANTDKANYLAWKIENCRNQLATIDFGFTDYNADFDIQSVNDMGTSQKVLCLEKFHLTTNDPDPETPGKFIISSGERQYEVIFTCTPNGKWLVQSDSCLDADPYYVNMDVLHASTTVEGPVQERYSYNGSLAKDYAETYWQNYNSAYSNCNCCGGDCMNFVSQCLKAGGWMVNSTWNYGATCTGSTSAWINGISWANYAINSGRIYAACYPDNALYAGDVMQIDWTGDGSIDHTMLVTTRTTSNGIVKIYLTGHNVNYYNQPSVFFNGTHYGRRVVASGN